MKLGKSNAPEIQGFETVEAAIDARGLSQIINNFLNYREPENSFIRETVSNAIDAARERDALIERGEVDPGAFDLSKRVVVEVNDSQFKLRDYGIGMSPERVDGYHLVFRSSKRDTNDQIGAFGAGRLSPLGYTDTFLVSTVYFGKKTTFIMKRGEHAPEIAMLRRDVDTSEPNGTTITVALKGRIDANVIEQTAYMDGIELRVDGAKPVSVYRGENFIWSSAANYDRPHICIDGVFYPLDRSQYRIKRSDKFAPLFDTGDLEIMWNREDIVYSDETVELLDRKFAEAFGEIERIHKEQNPINSMGDWFTYLAEGRAGRLLIDGERVWVSRSAELCLGDNYPSRVQAYRKAKSGWIGASTSWNKNIQISSVLTSKDRYIVAVNGSKVGISSIPQERFNGVSEITVVTHESADVVEELAKHIGKTSKPTKKQSKSTGKIDYKDKEIAYRTRAYHSYDNHRDTVRNIIDDGRILVEKGSEGEQTLLQLSDNAISVAPSNFAKLKELGLQTVADWMKPFLQEAADIRYLYNQNNGYKLADKYVLKHKPSDEAVRIGNSARYYGSRIVTDMLRGIKPSDNALEFTEEQRKNKEMYPLDEYFSRYQGEDDRKRYRALEDFARQNGFELQ